MVSFNIVSKYYCCKIMDQHLITLDFVYCELYIGLSLRFEVARYLQFISRWETEQPGSSFDLIFLLFPTKIARCHAHSNQGKSLPPPPPPPPAHIDSPGLYRYKIIYYETCKWYFKLTYYVQDHWTVSSANFVFACLLFCVKATLSSSGLLSMFKLVLLEHVIICRMVQGHMPQAMKEVQSY